MELCYEYFTTAKVCQNDMLRSYLLIVQIFCNQLWEKRRGSRFLYLVDLPYLKQAFIHSFFQEVGHSSAL